MLLALFVLTVAICSYWLGRQHETLIQAVETLREMMTEKTRKEEKPQAVIIDPDDIVARTKWEYEQRMKILNPKDADDLPSL